MKMASKVEEAIEPLKVKAETLAEHPLPFDDLEKELEDYTVPYVKSVIEEGILKFNESLEKIARCRERVYGISETAHGHLDLWDDLLERIEKLISKMEAYAVVRKEVTKLSSRELREAKVQTMVMSALDLRDFIEDHRRRAKQFADKTDRLLNHLDKVNQSVSRQITVVQEAHNLGEIQRGDLPYAVARIGDKDSEDDPSEE